MRWKQLKMTGNHNLTFSFVCGKQISRENSPTADANFRSLDFQSNHMKLLASSMKVQLHFDVILKCQKLVSKYC